MTDPSYMALKFQPSFWQTTLISLSWSWKIGQGDKVYSPG